MGIRRHGMIGEVACHDLPQPQALLRNRGVEAPSQLLLDGSELGSHAITPRLPSELEVAAPGLGANMRKAQEREGVRLSHPAPFAVRRRMTAELDETRLFRMKVERKPLQPFAHIREEPL